MASRLRIKSVSGLGWEIPTPDSGYLNVDNNLICCDNYESKKVDYYNLNPEPSHSATSSIDISGYSEIDTSKTLSISKDSLLKLTFEITISNLSTGNVKLNNSFNYFIPIWGTMGYDSYGYEVYTLHFKFMDTEYSYEVSYKNLLNTVTVSITITRYLDDTYHLWIYSRAGGIGGTIYTYSTDAANRIPIEDMNLSDINGLQILTNAGSTCRTNFCVTKLELTDGYTLR